MSLRAKLEKRIKDKEVEIQALEMKLMEARAYLQATQDALRLLPKEDSAEKEGVSDVVVRPGTTLEQVLNLLKQVGRPMRVMDILKAIGKEQSNENRQALVGSVGSYARKGHIFLKTGPNTFGLLEWKQQKSSGKSDLPDDFGLR